VVGRHQNTPIIVAFQSARTLGGLGELADHRDGDEAHQARDHGQDKEQAHGGQQAGGGALAGRHLVTLTMGCDESHVGRLTWALFG
jgi:hypothetical protein